MVAEVERPETALGRNRVSGLLVSDRCGTLQVDEWDG
jgi:hypothetical protein